MPTKDSSPDQSPAITNLLREWRGGNQAALEKLTPLIYEELRIQSGRIFRAERPGHTLQPTAVVNEAFIRLAGASVDWQDRAHFFALAARTMRRLLIDHAKARVAEKRGGQQLQVTFEESALGGADMDLGLLDVEKSLAALAREDARKAELMELKLFGGLSFAELSEVTGLSTSTLDREIRFARAWMTSRLSDENI